MPAFLLTWNPAKWEWGDVAHAADRTASGLAYKDRWSCGNTKAIEPGDRLFLLRQAVKPKGLVASGTALSTPYQIPHWDETLAEEGKTVWTVDILFDRVLDPSRHRLLDPAAFDGSLAGVNWRTQSSGIRISSEAVDDLEATWERHLRGSLEPTFDDGTRHRNPPWQRDELILALDLYVRHAGTYLSETHPEIVELSGVLNALPIHPDRDGLGTFRNPNGVSMKLLNFRRFDENQSGVGLKRGNRLEQEVWDAYAGHPERLRRVADAVRQGYGNKEAALADGDDEESFPEGKVLYRLHRSRERNRKVIEKAKRLAKEADGRLRCFVCSFDFAERYGSLGEDFIEGHHTKPVSELADGGETKIKDIALVCSNCHRMIHKRRPWLTVERLSSILR